MTEKKDIQKIEFCTNKSYNKLRRYKLPHDMYINTGTAKVRFFDMKITFMNKVKTIMSCCSPRLPVRIN